MHWGCIIGAFVGAYCVGMFGFCLGLRQGIRRVLCEKRFLPYLTAKDIEDIRE